MDFSPSLLRLYFVMGSQDCAGRDPAWVLEEAIAGGITLFQLREKGSSLTLGETVALGRRLKAICDEHRIPLIVNDRADLAMILGADGVHVGQDDLPADEVRQLIGTRSVLGVSCETPEEALQTRNSGAEYIGTGAMYATSSKPDAGKPVGPAAVEHIRAEMKSCPPIVGIGGITAANATPVIRAGAEGVAVISAIASAENPRRAAGNLRETVETTLSNR
ncbi:thiamine phosphate synthase [Paludifilum halophilum]|uniref:Thiamine-phosphate synthase n=1 Tax=Paludifilum halophilum TaxID=1642702 RepID=A0A235B8Z3_9BACL|nr:thiamine phosphate synthase [Paludifilum halophilum]OYD08357.1 thiamine phosphate synthase [Paludifilum halophilum]